MANKQEKVNQDKKCYLCGDPAQAVFENRDTGLNLYVCNFHHILLLAEEQGSVKVSKDGRSIML